jgi:hypothetical protein
MMNVAHRVKELWGATIGLSVLFSPLLCAHLFSACHCFSRSGYVSRRAKELRGRTMVQSALFLPYSVRLVLPVIRSSSLRVFPKIFFPKNISDQFLNSINFIEYFDGGRFKPQSNPNEQSSCREVHFRKHR